MRARFPDLDVIFIESGGDNLAATFSPELADLTLYVIDVAGGEKMPRKGGPAITRSDLLIVNKIDLAPYVGADLDVMEADTKRMRGGRPFVFTDTLRRKGSTGSSPSSRRPAAFPTEHSPWRANAVILPFPAGLQQDIPLAEFSKIRLAKQNN